MSTTVAPVTPTDEDLHIEVIVREGTCHDGDPLHERLAFIRDHCYGGDEITYANAIAKAAGVFSCSSDHTCTCDEDRERRIKQWADRLIAIRKAAKLTQKRRKQLH